MFGLVGEDGFVKLLKALDVSLGEPVDPADDDALGVSSIVP
ncbi:hypothetical protein C497_06864 [Halalkalicoccus jeotgali B3]|uniref:Uncharacterized protein n=1 Tax=Halalkalicoccus jeotgali (strain DSM 18796 / CECT 7217 / JCM 14584 / KCTC 4019 / B3) TaxID=795797 RepID=D8JC15_HALJB|nr:hypothetical protein HacjB3_17898 [Halalkalicoccus jeotgali B3]ELY38641.1 hypothetical protein C497_06864 [Halalkalicoccus jeotgali B3]